MNYWHNSIDFLQININQLGKEEMKDKQEVIVDIIQTTFLHLKYEHNREMITTAKYYRCLGDIIHGLKNNGLEDSNWVDYKQILQEFNRAALIADYKD